MRWKECPHEVPANKEREKRESPGALPERWFDAVRQLRKETAFCVLEGAEVGLEAQKLGQGAYQDHLSSTNTK